MTSSSTLPSLSLPLFALTGTCWFRNVRSSHPSEPKLAPFPCWYPPTPHPHPWDLHIMYYFLLSMTTSPWQLTSKQTHGEERSPWRWGGRTSVSEVSDIFASAQVQKPWSHVCQRLIKGLIFSSPGWRAEWNTPVPPLPTLLFLKHTYGTPYHPKVNHTGTAAHLILHVFRGWPRLAPCSMLMVPRQHGLRLFKLNKFPSPFSGVQRGQCFRVTSVMNEWQNTQNRPGAKGRWQLLAYISQRANQLCGPGCIPPPLWTARRELALS